MALVLPPQDGSVRKLDGLSVRRLGRPTVSQRPVGAIRPNLAFTVAGVFAVAHSHKHRRILRRAEIESPFKDGVQQGRPKLALTEENIEMVLDELRPYLQKDGGDCKLIEIEGPILRLEMQGSCASCSSSAITVKMGIERTMLDRFPEIYEVEAVMPGFKVPTEEGIEEVLSTIGPFLSVSGGSIELIELDDGEGVNPRPTIVLGIGGPPAKNASLKAEVLRRIKFVYGQAEIQLLELVLEDD